MAVGYNPSIVTNGLVGYWDAANIKSYPGSGTTWNNLASSSNGTTLVNSPTFSTSNSGYFTFNGSTQYATVAGNPLNANSYTKCIWFYLNATADNNLMSQDDGAGSGHYMFFGGASKLYCGHTSWTGFPYTYPSSRNFSNSTWYFVALTFNTTDGMSLYVNGNLDSTYTAQKTAPIGTGCNFGCYAAAGNLLNGRISQASIYNKTLTAAEVSQNFNAQRGRYGI
jgi:hypothetical protein